MDEYINNTFGNNLRYYRKKAGLTLIEMSEKVGISFATYQKYETGQIKHVGVDVVLDCAKVLNVAPADLVGWEVKVTDMSKERLTEMKDNVKEFVDLFQNATPEAQALVENFLKSSQQKP